MSEERSRGRHARIYRPLLTIDVDANIGVTVYGILEGGATATNGPIYRHSRGLGQRMVEIRSSTQR